MSDISLPPDAPKKKALENKGLRSMLLFVALLAPLPLMISASDLWLSHTPEGQAMGQTPFGLIRQIVNGSGDPPLWLLPLCVLPSFIMLMILGRSAASRVITCIILLFFAAGELLFMGQLGEGFIR